MTGAQKNWLDSNKPYRAVFKAAGFSKWTKRGILHADGKFELIERGKTPRITQGCFEVGVLTNEIPGSAQR
jgi:hypothetical protein